MTVENPIEELNTRAQLTADELTKAILALTEDGSEEREHADKLAKEVLKELDATTALFKKHMDEGSRMSTGELFLCQAKAMVCMLRFEKYLDKLREKGVSAE